MAMTEAAREKRREYKRNWNRANRDKVKQYQERYWTKKVEEDKQKTAEGQVNKNDPVL